MIAALRRDLDGVKRRVHMAVGRCVLAAVDDSKKLQALQVNLLAGETADQVERFQSYGLTSKPYPGAEGIMVSIGGLRSHGVVIAVDDRRYRLTGLADGEVALYDDQGQSVWLKRDGVHIASAHKVVVTAPEVDVIADTVNLGAAGGPAVARVGDPVVGGVITAGSAKVFAA